MRCLGLVVHPTRPLDVPLGALRAWAAAHGVAVVQVATLGEPRHVADAGPAADCDLVVALGGDGTTLAALHAAAPADRPVLGVACGSLGALTATGADAVAPALDAFAAGRWAPRSLPALVADVDGAGTAPWHALNDLALVRAGAGQVVVDVRLAGETFIRFSGDGILAATPLGSSAYTLAVGGPLLGPGAAGFALTALAPHGGVVPPLVTGEPVTIGLDPGHGGARLEVDGQILLELRPHVPASLTVRLEPGHAQLVTLGDQETAIAGLRRRRLLVDSPRILARDDRERGRG